MDKAASSGELKVCGGARQKLNVYAVEAKTLRRESPEKNDWM